MKVLYLGDLRADVSETEEATAIAESAAPEGAQAYARAILTGVRERREEIDRLIAAQSPNWDLRRMAATDRNVLRIGCWELLWGGSEVPPVVAIDEAVGLAKRFGAEGSGAFVNGILDAIRRRQGGAPSGQASDAPAPSSAEND